MSESPFDSTPHTPRVLIVEDEGRMRDMLLRALPDMGLEADGARSAEEALAMLERGDYRILVLDLNLPGMSGLEMLERIRPKMPRLQVVVLTGYGDLEAAKQAIHLDVVEFLTKPCTLGELERALERARQRAAPDRDQRLSAHARNAAARDTATPPSPGAGPDAEQQAAADPHDADAEGGASSSDEAANARTLEELERLHILKALQRNEGNRAATARELGISVRTLYYRLSEYQKKGLM